MAIRAHSSTPTVNKTLAAITNDESSLFYISSDTSNYFINKFNIGGETLISQHSFSGMKAVSCSNISDNNYWYIGLELQNNSGNTSSIFLMSLNILTMQNTGIQITGINYIDSIEIIYQAGSLTEIIALTKGNYDQSSTGDLNSI